MNIAVCSVFRNSVSYVGRYFTQIAGLRAALAARGDAVELMLGEGDSLDGTRGAMHDFITQLVIKATIVDVAHGGPEFTSVVDALRFLQCAYAGNLIWSRIPVHADVVVFIDSDIIWDTSTLISLIDSTKDYPAIAPLVIHQGYPGDRYYNVFDFRINGVHFTHNPPYHAGLDLNKITQVDSAGSCLVMRGDMARQVHFCAQDVIVGMCRLINEVGGSIWCNPALRVFHPYST